MPLSADLTPLHDSPPVPLHKAWHLASGSRAPSSHTCGLGAPDHTGRARGSGKCTKAAQASSLGSQPDDDCGLIRSAALARRRRNFSMFDDGTMMISDVKK